MFRDRRGAEAGATRAGLRGEAAGESGARGQALCGRTLFGLTASEARLARLMASGDAIDDIAETVGIKIATARSQLAVVFSKVGVNRQIKLVAIAESHCPSR